MRGYDESCFGYYTGENGDPHFSEPIRNSELINDAIAAPLFQQVVDYLREKHGLLIYVHKPNQHNSSLFLGRIQNIYNTEKSNSYYEALTRAINQALRLTWKN